MAARRPRHMEKLVVTPQLNSRPARREAAHTLESAGNHPLLARLWAARGITDANQAKVKRPAMIPHANHTNSEYGAAWSAEGLSDGNRLLTMPARGRGGGRGGGGRMGN